MRSEQASWCLYRFIILFLQVKVIFDEFYEQGDDERKAGRIPLPMMDRTKVHLQPNSQVDFISGICIPCYSLLNKLIPETKPLLDGCLSNLEQWKEEKERVENRLGNSDTDDGAEPTSTTLLSPLREQRGLISRAHSLPIQVDFDIDFD